MVTVVQRLGVSECDTDSEVECGKDECDLPTDTVVFPSLVSVDLATQQLPESPSPSDCAAVRKTGDWTLHHVDGIGCVLFALCGGFPLSPEHYGLACV